MRERAALLANAEIIEVENSDDDNNEDAAEEDTAEQDTAEEDTAEQDTAEQDTAEQDTAEQDTAEQDTAEQDTADYFEDEEGIELDLTVFGTGIPTFDFMPAPRRTVRVPARNHRQSPMFVFGDTAMPPASAFETPTNNPETQSTTLPLTPPIIEMTRTPVEPTDSLQEITDSLQESGFEWTPINLEISGTMTRLVARPEMEPADTEESITDE
jgi:flagellar biosynthesis GTPase FlhF